jgi:hypothetical protein
MNLDTIKMSVERRADSLLFRLAHPSPLIVFLVADVNGESVWKFQPAEMVGGDVSGYSVAFPLPRLAEQLVARLIPNHSQAILDDLMPIDAISYGTVPHGYRQIIAAKPLMRGQLYRAFAMKVMEYGIVEFTID